MRIFVLFMVLLLTTAASGQTGWQWGRSSVYTTLDDPGFVARGASIDDSGNVLVTGINNGGSGVNYTVYGADTVYNLCNCQQHVVVKIDSNGNFLWSDGSENAMAMPGGIGADRNGNVYTFGWYDSSSITFGPYTLVNPGVSSYYLVKYSPGGNVLWARNVGHGTKHLVSGNMGTDGAGYIYVSGYFYSPTMTIDGITLTNTSSVVGDTADVFVAKFDKLGNVIWAKNFGGKAGEIPYAMTVASSGNVYLTGFYGSDTMWVDGITLPDSPGVLNTPFFIKFDSAGNAIWAHSYNAGLEIYALTTDAAENIYVTGLLKGDVVLGSDSLDNRGVFNTYVAKYDDEGGVVWARCAGGTYIDQGWSIAADNCDNVWVSGLAYGLQHLIVSYTINFGSYTLIIPDSSWNPTFVAQYTTSGTYLSSLALPSGNFHEYILANNRGSFYLAGSYRMEPMFFGPDTLATPVLHVNEEIFIAKNRYDSTGCYSMPLQSTVTERQFACTIFPNPAINEFTIYSDVKFLPGAHAELYDISGRVLGNYLLAGNNTIRLPEISVGVYLCKIISGDDVVIKKLVVVR